MALNLNRRTRQILWAIAFIVGIPFTTKLVLRYGPSAMAGSGRPAPGLFGFHANAILRAELGYPRQIEGYLPPPNRGSSEAVQLTGMGLWDGHNWTAQALNMGTLEGRGLRVQVGRLSLDSMEEATPARDYNGPQLCQVDYLVKWSLPEELSDLVSKRKLIGLRLPTPIGMEGPGAVAHLQVTLERSGLGWKLQDPDRMRAGVPGRPLSRGWAWLSPLL
jgi:hypothetical protein